MKKILTLLVFILLPAISSSQVVINELMEQEKREEFHRRREEWIRNMHRCEENLPYWILDNKAKETFHKSTSKSNLDATLENSYANGRIIGKWIEKGSNNQSGRVHTLDIDTNDWTIFLASAGGNIWRGSINGNDWVCMNNSHRFPNPRMVRILFVEGKRRVVVAANSPSSVYYTDYYGTTWTKAKGFDNAEKWGWTIRGQVTLNQNVYVLLTEWDMKAWKSMVSLYKSTDFAQTFVPIYSLYLDYSNALLCDIWAPRYDKNILYFAVKDTLYIVDAQDNFNIVSINSFIDQYTERVMVRGSTSGNNVNIYLGVVGNNVQTSFYYSSNGGKTFTQQGKLNFYPFEVNSFEVSQLPILNPYYTQQNVYFGQVEFYCSTNNALHWNRLNSWTEYYSKPETKLHADIPGILSIRKWDEKQKDFIDYVFACTDGGLYLLQFKRGYYQPTMVKNLSLKNLNISQYYSIYTYEKKGKILFAGSQDQGFQRCLNDSGKVLSFSQLISGDYGHLCSSNGGFHLWGVYPGFAMLVVQPNMEQSLLKTWNFVGRRFLWMPPIVPDPDTSIYAYLVGGDNEVSLSQPASFIYKLKYFESLDSMGYEVLPFNFAQDKINRQLTYLAISPFDRKVWYAITNDGKFFRSTDEGINWEMTPDFSGPGNHYLYGTKILPSRLQFGKIVVAGSGYSNKGVYISYDNGATFVPLDNSIPSTMFYDVEFNEDESLLFAATEIGPFVYHFAERRWYSLSGENCPDQIFWDLEYLPELKTLRCATYGRGIWDFQIEKVLDVAETKPNIAKEINIQVFPNPTSSSTHIEIETQPETNLSVEIFDTQGRLVRNLWNGFEATGKLHLEWDGKTDDGYRLPSGNYFVIVTSRFVSRYSIIKLER